MTWTSNALEYGDLNKACLVEGWGLLQEFSLGRAEIALVLDYCASVSLAQNLLGLKKMLESTFMLTHSSSFLRSELSVLMY